MMNTALALAAFAAIHQVAAQWGHKQQPGEPPYRPVAPVQLFEQVSPAPVPYTPKSPVIPKLSGTPQILGLANDPALNRDSVGSVTFGDRTFWTSRDTQLYYSNGSVQTSPVITSTASWSNLGPRGGPSLESYPPTGEAIFNFTVLNQYGNNSIAQAFYPVTSDFCTPPSGSCPDKTRYALWPDLPPMVAESNYGDITAYTWIRQSHIRPDLTTVIENPASLLYRVNYDTSTASSSPDALPEVTVVDENFWAAGEIAFGNYGNVVKDGIAYLYGQANGTTALAQVPVDQVEDRAAYEYWVNGEWTTQMPALGQSGINITNANAGGQGTYYYSEAWESYVWIGGLITVGAEMYITTAPDPTGPWIQPIHFFTGTSGDYFLGAYSIQAHPGLAAPGQNEIYVTYTKNDLDADGVNVYTSPLVRVQWE